jgi:hypothetical protein
MTHLPLHRLHVEPHRIYRELRQSLHGLPESTTIREDTTYSTLESCLTY